ncbi:MAG: ATP-binding protein [bacterium]|nr:ATP-binding protein [bacterium]
MKRIITEELLEWKQKRADRMPLVLYGARQVGKTYILQEFGREYFRNTVYVNFERMPIVAEYFDGDLRPERLIRLLEEHFHTRVVPEETLLIFDEVQACERALTSLKYFCEDAPEYHVVAAGSLLGVAINREKYSFPVGKVYMKTMYPLRFDEFLWAMGQEALEREIREHYAAMTPMPDAAHRELRSWWLRYLYVGGMPAAVSKYVQEKSLINVAEMQELISNAYTADMSKYASESDSTRIRAAYLSLPAQLAKENKKFQYRLIRKGATAGLFGDSIAWLSMAGVVIQSDLVTRGEVPVKAFRDVSAFKLYLSDVGLLSAQTRLMPDSLLREEISDLYKGALAENYVAQTLHAGGHELFYWGNDSPAAEVDFVIQKEGKVIPIEVKYDVNVHARSLKHYCRLYAPEYAIRITGRNFGCEDGIISLPLYAAYCI